MDVRRCRADHTRFHYGTPLCACGPPFCWIRRCLHKRSCVRVQGLESGRRVLQRRPAPQARRSTRARSHSRTSVSGMQCTQGLRAGTHSACGTGAGVLSSFFARVCVCVCVCAFARASRVRKRAEGGPYNGGHQPMKGRRVVEPKKKNRENKIARIRSNAAQRLGG